MGYGYKVATYQKQLYKGELLTFDQWKKKGYKPKSGVEPHGMWSNQQTCSSGDPNRYVFDYYYDYEVERDNEYIEFFKSQAEEIEKCCNTLNKKKVAELVGRLYGSVSISYYFGHITLDDFYEWDKKIKEYQKRFV